LAFKAALGDMMFIVGLPPHMGPDRGVQPTMNIVSPALSGQFGCCFSTSQT
jgi:hypothetical protein